MTNILSKELKEYLKKKNFTLLKFQEESIIATHSRLNTLIISPTGTGKTFATFAGILNELLDLQNKNLLENKTYAIYISPLRALTYDIEKNLNSLLEFSEQKNIRIGVWTSDIKNKKNLISEKAHILLTTPESFAIILQSLEFLEINWLVVDEIHAILENKRAPYLSLLIDLLKKLNKTYFSTTYLTATYYIDIEKYLGVEKIIENQEKKAIETEFLMTKRFDFHECIEKIIDIKKKRGYRTILIFTNTRNLAELMTIELRKRNQNVEIHHSSLSYPIRKDVEDKLKKGEVDFVVSSTSLELGIDIGNIDAVILFGSPKTITKAIQRIGRSGHGLGKISRGIFIPINMRDMLEELGIISGIRKGIREKISVVKNPYDVLAHFILLVSLINRKSKLISVENIKEIVTKNPFFYSFSLTEFNKIIEFYVKLNYISNQDFPVCNLPDYKILPKLGPIPHQDVYSVKEKNRIIGSIDEEFYDYLIKKDAFSLGGKFYAVKDFNEKTIIVTETNSGNITHWYSQYLPMSLEVGNEIISLLKKVLYIFKEYDKRKIFLDIEKQTIFERIREVIPFLSDELYDFFKMIYLFYENISTNLLVEDYKNEKHYLIFHTFLGKKINESLSKLFSAMVSDKDVEIGIDDLSFYLCAEKLNPEKILKVKQLSDKEIYEIIKTNVVKTLSFRKNLKKLARKFYFHSYFSEKLDLEIVKMESIREFLYDVLDFENVIKLIREKEIVISKTDVLSPLSISMFENIYQDVLIQTPKSEFLEEMQKLLMNKISLKIAKITSNRISEKNNDTMMK
ncbi:MAG: DEAD/DEAH box helicase [Candidatus Woesearchaeota archaeon]